ncbi:MAG: XrtN system VIT domain-containing protein [Cytophagales bacterium]|nr:XrtN system VIT domain-containing protein [Cytophagales bacterium]
MYQILTKFKELSLLQQIGLFLICISFGVFIFSDYNTQSLNGFDDWFLIFCTNYAIAFIYLVAWISTGNFKWSKLYSDKISFTLTFQLLCFISCFSLNHSISIFKSSTDWLQIVLVVSCLSLVIKFLNWGKQRYIQPILYFWLGVACIVQLYYASYLIPLYGIGLLASFFLGISLHIFTPLFLFIGLILFMKRELKQKEKVYHYSFWAGILIPFVVLIFITFQYGAIHRTIKNSSKISHQTGLPKWVVLSQRLPNNWFGKLLLKSELKGDIRWNDIPNGDFDFRKVHDPLLTIADLVNSGNHHINYHNRKKIAVSRLNLRHETTEKLWRGTDLSTETIKTSVQLFPSYRMAYTEKEITIKNSYKYSSTRWRNSDQQEALYTFFLPEGSVITSLSLWIEGEERKGILTSKQQADSAYQTIVGRERRDPSLVTWQEGNTVSVRVFPCTPKDNRRFKLGITSPLTLYDDELIYESIYFKGPHTSHAEEEIFILKNKENPLHFDNISLIEKDKKYYHKGDYHADWKIRCKAPELSKNSFCFDNQAYSLQPYEEEYAPQNFENIYLDINKEWTKEELFSVWKAVQNKNVYIFTTEWKQVTEENKDDLFDELTNFNFSLLPIFQLPNENNCLIVTKASEIAPQLSDVRGNKQFARRWAKEEHSSFHKSLSLYEPSKPLPLFNIGKKLSPYLKTLRELRYFQYAQGETSLLTNLLQKGVFVKNQEDNQHIVLHDSRTVLVNKIQAQEENKAPDHLLRLFEYNYIMKNIQQTYFTEKVDTNLVNRAKKAYVVSPLSSLIVLETQEDYDRFNIKKTENSLGNAGIDGAVPEPHEWALIILSILAMLYLLFKKRFSFHS